MRSRAIPPYDEKERSLSDFHLLPCAADRDVERVTVTANILVIGPRVFVRARGSQTIVACGAVYKNHLIERGREEVIRRVIGALPSHHYILPEHRTGKVSVNRSITCSLAVAFDPVFIMWK